MRNTPGPLDCARRAATTSSAAALLETQQGNLAEEVAGLQRDRAVPGGFDEEVAVGDHVEAVAGLALADHDLLRRDIARLEP